MDKYKEFRERNSRHGIYIPELVESSLLSTLTPDPKAIILLAMENGKWYFTRNELYDDVLEWLEELGVEYPFPITVVSTWTYCERIENEKKVSGSLVDTGVVEKGVIIRGFRAGRLVIGDWAYAYRISDAGIELARPLIARAIDFVHKARNSKIPHRYDSMWKIFGSVNSKTEKRRPSAVSKILRFLVENKGEYRVSDLIDEFEGEIDDEVVSLVLNSLGHAGIIDFESPYREIKGKKARGWVTYSLNEESKERLSNFDEIYSQVIECRPYFSDLRSWLRRIVEYIAMHPDEIYESNKISEALKAYPNDVSRCLSALEEIGILKRESGFKGGEIHSRARANDLTRMLCDDILYPAHELATTLNPRGLEPVKLDASDVEEFLMNYKEERTHLGVAGGIEVRDVILRILEERKEPVKLSEIIEKGNEILGRDLTPKAFCRHLFHLIRSGEIEKIGKGYYKIRDRNK